MIEIDGIEIYKPLNKDAFKDLIIKCDTLDEFIKNTNDVDFIVHLYSELGYRMCKGYYIDKDGNTISDDIDFKRKPYIDYRAKILAEREKQDKGKNNKEDVMMLNMEIRIVADRVRESAFVSKSKEKRFVLTYFNGDKIVADFVVGTKEELDNMKMKIKMLKEE